MTVRDHLRSKIKKAYIVGFTGWLLLAGSIVLAPKASPVTVYTRADAFFRCRHLHPTRGTLPTLP